jgi:copper chaperone
MSCGGCSGAVTRVLKKAQEEGATTMTNKECKTDQSETIGSVSSFDVSLETQLVDVTGSIEEEDLVGKIKKTGKEVSS